MPWSGGSDPPGVTVAASESALRTAPPFVLAGRPEFIVRLAAGCAARGRHGGSGKLAVLCVDLDRFKHINAAFGHAFGDAVLRAVAMRLRSAAEDAVALAHLAGDEFALAMPVADAAAALSAAHRIRDLLAAPLSLGTGPVVSVSGSVGVSLYPDHGDDSAALLNRADIALYRAKEGGQENCQLYHPSMEDAPRQRQHLLVALHEAIEHEQFSLAFQPKLALAAGRYAGAEVLVRWLSPTLGEMSPERFVPVAEDAGLIHSIGDWVLSETIETMRGWRNAHLPARRLAVNVSAAQLKHENFGRRIAALMQSVGSGGPELEIEITESALMANVDLAAHRLAEAKALGVGVTLDDFGTGYSTFSHLKHLPIDAIKIAPDFIADIIEDPAAARLVAAMIAMARTLELRVVAEGVETAAQAAFLAGHGCDEGQGYLFARPMATAEFEAWLAEHVR